MNKFEQVSSDYHQLSVAEVDIPGPRSGGGGNPRSHVGGGMGIPGPMCGGGVPYYVTYPMMHIMYLHTPTPRENITFPRLRLRALKTRDIWSWRKGQGDADPMCIVFSLNFFLKG